MSTIICERCGKKFTRTSKSKICPECRLEASRKLDKKVKALHEAGTTYAEAQKAETLASLPKIEIPELQMKVETPEAIMVEPGSGGNGADYIRQVNEDLARTLKEGKEAAAEKAWNFAKAIRDLPAVLCDQLFSLNYEDAVLEAQGFEAILADALGIE